VVGAAAVVSGWWVFAGDGASVPQIRSVAVLPIDNLSGDPGQEYLVLGLQEAIIAELAQNPAFHKVTSRGSTRRYQDSDQPRSAIASELGVDAVVEGSVLPAGDRVSITLQLIDGQDDRHLWTDTFERDSRDALAMMTDVARAVGREIALVVGPEALSSLEGAGERQATHSTNPEANDAYLKGRWHFNNSLYIKKDYQNAIRYYEEATAHDPDFAAAHAALAEVLLLQNIKELDRGAAAARRAVTLDPNLPEAHAALGVARTWQWNWDGAEASFQRAIDLNPNSAVAHEQYADLLMVTMRDDEALSEARRAAELDPFSFLIKWKVGSALFSQRRFNEAIEVYDEVLELEPDAPLIAWNRGLQFAMLGSDSAIAIARRLERTAPPEAGGAIKWLLAFGHLVSGSRDSTMAILRQLEAVASGFSPNMIASLHSLLGNDDTALNWLESAYAVRDPHLPGSTSAPWFDNLRDHPRFQALRAKMELP
jgi:TolB-like protein/tetratricopeptide (TPR) repeat protein